MMTPTSSGRHRVAVFTGTRAEYGLLVPILRRLRQSDEIDLSLIVSGAHLSLLHGMTITAIEADGFEIDATIEMLLANDSATAITKSLGLSLIELAGTFDRLRPELVVVLGDRYEILAAATAALIAGIPVAHIHGGEVTEGAFDDSVRHAVTKLAHLHFVATEEFAKRIRQLGEQPGNIYVVGAPALDVITEMAEPDPGDIAEFLGSDLVEPVVLVVYHPSTIPGEDPEAATEEIIAAIDGIDAGTVVCSLPNADPKFNVVRQRLEEFARRRPNAVAAASIGHERYLALLRRAAVIVGNSSSGIIEATALGTPTVNVGQRQAGRPVSPTVRTVPPERQAIAEALRWAILPESQELARVSKSPYDSGVSVAAAVVDVIEHADLDALIRKKFYDLGDPD